MRFAMLWKLADMNRLLSHTPCTRKLTLDLPWISARPILEALRLRYARKSRREDITVDEFLAVHGCLGHCQFSRTADPAPSPVHPVNPDHPNIPTCAVLGRAQGKVPG